MRYRTYIERQCRQERRIARAPFVLLVLAAVLLGGAAGYLYASAQPMTECELRVQMTIGGPPTFEQMVDPAYDPQEIEWRVAAQRALENCEAV